ncbi:anaerobic nitric oxide reductase flavorubredoxin [Natranaerobius thermophilus JW/NM-WN-LF]|uniref:Anaerobic nitric oxide reductase flavorubredoxin n=1 Tax=Natranaerobius thermophilus (strain ATCC BAA-1301 / DSM 18059 / JW/NM-WN-LF) TaxID=457570 RepID=B2A1H7_NATTJ|nr:anaerobic nitric oxide reductase flavorubredoxin [Natranaerobius thermophilus JW/NM-WN-LF]
MNRKITESITWVGKIDWDLNTFHGQELRSGILYSSGN